MKSALTALALFLCLTVNGQNDSLLPNYYAIYNVLHSYIDQYTGWEYTQQSIVLYNFDQDDTIYIDSEVDPVGKLISDSNKVYFLDVTGNYVYQDSLVLLYDFGLNVGDTAYYEHLTFTGPPT